MRILLLKCFEYFSISLLLLGLGSDFAHAHAHADPDPEKRIGIVLPQDHAALREIIDGFEAELKKQYPHPIKIKIVNAQGDINLQRALLMQMREENYHLIIPISTNTSQMAATLIKNKPLLALACEKCGNTPNLTAVDDEPNINALFKLIHATYPLLKNITLVHSTSDKIFSEIAEVTAAANQYGIALHRLSIQNLPELYSLGQAIPKDTEAILLLKDNVIVSGIDTLVRVAQKRKLLLITSDDASVKAGASFGLGIPEEKIGAEGAKLAAKILSGVPVSQLPPVKINTPVVFISAKTTPKVIQIAAEKLRYKVQKVS